MEYEKGLILFFEVLIRNITKESLLGLISATPKVKPIEDDQTYVHLALRGGMYRFVILVAIEKLDFDVDY